MNSLDEQQYQTAATSCSAQIKHNRANQAVWQAQQRTGPVLNECFRILQHLLHLQHTQPCLKKTPRPGAAACALPA